LKKKQSSIETLNFSKKTLSYYKGLRNSKMKEKFISKNYKPESWTRILLASEIIQEYSEKGFTLTLRQLYYQFVARGKLENSERSYKNLGKLISNARLSGDLDWNAIEDRTRSIGRPSSWSSPRDILRAAYKGYRRDRWAGQKYSVEVWIEKEALSGVIAPVCQRWDLTSFACKGYVSQSVQWRAAKHFEDIDDDVTPVILHLGDHDPSGQDMTRDIEDRIRLLSNDREFILERIALNMDQIEELNPPPNPTKLSDSRAGAYIAKYGTSSWELDALPPDYIDNLIEKFALQYIDIDLREDVLQLEKDERQKIEDFAKTFSENGEDD